MVWLVITGTSDSGKAAASPLSSKSRTTHLTRLAKPSPDCSTYGLMLLSCTAGELCYLMIANHDMSQRSMRQLFLLAWRESSWGLGSNQAAWLPRELQRCSTFLCLGEQYNRAYAKADMVTACLARCFRNVLSAGVKVCWRWRIGGICCALCCDDALSTLLPVSRLQ